MFFLFFDLVQNFGALWRIRVLKISVYRDMDVRMHGNHEGDLGDKSGPGTAWGAPPPSNSQRQNYYMLGRESL